MRLPFLAVMTIVTACSPVEPHRPFQAREWESFPSSDELVAAMVGDGGDDITRAASEAIARDLLLSSVESQGLTLQDLPGRFRDWSRSYREFVEVESYTAFLKTALASELGQLHVAALALAVRRAHDKLWPGQPPADDWKHLYAEAEHVSIQRVQARLDGLADDYGQMLCGVFGGERPGLWDDNFWLYRDVELIKNHLYVARTGDLAMTNGLVHEVLFARGIRSSVRHPLESPY